MFKSVVFVSHNAMPSWCFDVSTVYLAPAFLNSSPHSSGVVFCGGKAVQLTHVFASYPISPPKNDHDSVTSRTEYIPRCIKIPSFALSNQLSILILHFAAVRRLKSPIAEIFLYLLLTLYQIPPFDGNRP